jgi:hypothetical protein
VNDAVIDFAIDDYVERMGMEVLSLLKCIAEIHEVTIEEEVAGLASAFFAPLFLHRSDV